MPEAKAPIRVLLIEDDEDDSVLIRGILSEIPSAVYDVTWAETYDDALMGLREGRYDICLMDYRLGKRTGLELLRKVSDYADKPPIIFLTGQGDYRVDIEAMKSGAADYLVKDHLNDPMLERTIRYAIERRRSEKALRESERQLEYLSSQLLAVQENERRKVATELHDNLGQLLTAIKYNIESVINRLPEDANCACNLEQVIQLIQGAVEQVRRIYTQLRPTVLDDLGVKAALTWFCREFEDANARISVNKHFEIEEEDVPENLKLTMFRIVQDAMDNIAAHSYAQNVWLSLSHEDGFLNLSIRDDGNGFNVGVELSSMSSEGGLGLRSMKRRAELSGGILAVISEIGTGTTVRVKWPAKPALS